MPIRVPIPTRRLAQTEFGDIAYRVMEHAFGIHNEFGRFFDEVIYKRELADRVGNVQTEVPITVVHGTFHKQYFIDFFEGVGGIFELKCVDKLHPRHSAPMMNYLLMTDLVHGKVINFRPLKVEHRFVNATVRLAEQRAPRYVYQNWAFPCNETDALDRLIRELIADWGVGLTIELYDEAIRHLLGSNEFVPIHGSQRTIGGQAVSLISPTVAYKITALTKEHSQFRIHATRFLQHTTLQRLVWINLNIGEVRLEMIECG